MLKSPIGRIDHIPQIIYYNATEVVYMESNSYQRYYGYSYNAIMKFVAQQGVAYHDGSTIIDRAINAFFEEST